MRIKIVPDRVFYKLWTSVKKFNSKQHYIANFTISTNEEYINFYRKYDISYEKSIIMLGNIFEAYNKGLKEIMDEIGKTKAQLSKEFCIPIRTLESWYDGTNRMPEYIKLMILKRYYLLDIGKDIQLESDIEYVKRKPKIYTKQEHVQEVSQNELDLEDYIDEEEDFEKYLEQKLNKTQNKRPRSINKKQDIDIYSQSDVEQLLERTKYLDKLFRR